MLFGGWILELRYPDELLQYLRLVHLNKAQLHGRSLDDLDLTRRETDVNELMVLESISEACQAAIAQYPTTVSGHCPRACPECSQGG